MRPRRPIHQTVGLFVWVVGCLAATTGAFLAPTSHPSPGLPTTTKTTKTPTTTTTARECICIDCKWVTSCKAYHFVEEKHEQPHISEDPGFEPRDGSPTIHVNVRTVRTAEDRRKEIDRMWKEHSSETARAEQAAAAASDANDNNSNTSNSPNLRGETVYDLSPVTTYEYDVVSCEDFVEDRGAWVRNMPEEIRLANPDFVPS